MIDMEVYEARLRADAVRRGYGAALIDDYVQSGVAWLLKQRETPYVPCRNPKV